MSAKKTARSTARNKREPLVHTQKKRAARRAAKPAPAPTPGAPAQAQPAKPAAAKTARRHARRQPGTPAPAVPQKGAPPSPAPQQVSVAALVLAPAGAVGLPQSYASLVLQPPQYDPAAGNTAFQALAGNRAAIPKVLVARVDVQATALVSLGAYGFVAQVPALHDQFKALATAGLFSMTTLQNLKTAAFAALYAFNQAEKAGAFKTGAVVPAQLIADASTVEKRMQKRCEYVFASDPEVSPLLDMLRPGIGYNDLANDLLGYASIYESKKAQIAAANDPNYVATDLADAKSYAGQIMAYLTAAMSPQAATAFDALQRSYTLLAAIYAEVQAVGLMLLRFDPKRHTRFPSLTSAVRAAPKRKKSAANAPAAPAAPAAVPAPAPAPAPAAQEGPAGPKPAGA